MSQRPNFYVLLDLDPAIRDWAAIEARIGAKRDQWSRERIQAHPRARARAEQCQRWLAEIERCLQDPACREQEAQEAEALRAQEHARQGAELDELIDLIRGGGGGCDPERLDHLAEKFTGVFSREEIKERLRRAGVEILGDPPGGQPSTEPAEEFDRQTAREIRQRLDLLGLSDLYELLGLDKTAAPKQLQNRAAEIYRENRRLGRHDALATAQNDLASYCAVVFGSEGAKAAYDRYLVVETMERLTGRLELAGADGLLTREEMDALVGKAVELGVGAEAARSYIESLARDRGWKVDPGAASRPKPSSPSGPTASEPQTEGTGRYLGILMPYLRRLGRRPAVAVPASLTVLGMSAVLVASMGAPPPQAPATGSSTEGASVATGTSSVPSQPAPPAPSPTRSQPTSARPTGTEGSPAAAGLAAVPLPQGGASATSEQSPAGAPTEASETQRRESRPAPPPPAAPALPREPRIAVVAVGDERIGALVEETVGSALRGAGLEVRDPRGSLALTELLRASRGHPPVSELARALPAEGFDVLILAEIDPIGRRRLEFYGRTELATNSRVRLTAYSLFDQRSLGNGWVGEVEHTDRGATRQVSRAVAPGGADLAHQITDGWNRRLSQVGSRR